MKLIVTFRTKIFYFYLTRGDINLLLESALFTKEFIALITLENNCGFIGTFWTDFLGFTHCAPFCVVLKRLNLASTAIV